MRRKTLFQKRIESRMWCFPMAALPFPWRVRSSRWFFRAPVAEGGWRLSDSPGTSGGLGGTGGVMAAVWEGTASSASTARAHCPPWARDRTQYCCIGGRGHPHLRSAGKKGKSRVWVLWLQCQTKTTNRCTDQTEHVSAVTTPPPPPNMSRTERGPLGGQPR